MKQIVTLICLMTLMVACKNDNTEAEQERTDSFLIKGNAPGVYNGIRVFLNGSDENGRQMPLDTAMVMNGSFEFEGKLDRAKVMNITVNSLNGSIPLVVENGNINVEVNKDSLFKSKVTGSKAHQAFREYSDYINESNNKMRSMNMKYRQASMEKNDSLAKSISEAMGKENLALTTYTSEFVDKNLDNKFSLLLLENSLKMQQPDLSKIENTYNRLSDDLKSSKLGQEVKQQLEEIKKINEAFANTEVGKVAPDFAAPNPDGKMLALNDIKGKATLIDFWAAWCGPCRRENPNVVKVYEKYHGKGLEIISVSLDGSRNQKDPKAAWMKAIEDDKLTWNHVSNLQYFNDPVARMFNIQSIPATFLLDESGTIVAKNLRGPALEEKVSELLD